jgi:hypothetical protein
VIPFSYVSNSYLFSNITADMEHDTATPAGLRVNTIVLAFTLVSGVVVFLRIFTRLVISKGAGFEDACVVLAMVSNPGMTSALCH